MTDADVEKFLIERFESIGEPLLTSKLIGDKTVYTNVFYPNKAFTRPTDGYWFKIYFLRTPPFMRALGQSAPNRWRGIMQIDTFVPKDSGTDALDGRYNKIFEKFRRGYITNGIRILSVGRSSARTTEDYCFQSVSISWEADLEN